MGVLVVVVVGNWRFAVMAVLECSQISRCCGAPCLFLDMCFQAPALHAVIP
jgi:hypothetical protein